MFSDPGCAKKHSKITPESLLALELAPRASWRPLGLDVWILLAPQNGSQRGQESKLKFEAFFVPPRGTNSMGRRQSGGPSGRGLLGSLPTVDAGFSKLCLSQCFRNPHLASLTAPSEPEAQWPDLQWACGPKPATEPAALCASVPQWSR